MNTIQPKEGYIKFKCHLTTEKPTIPSELFFPLNDWRNELWLKCLIGAYSNGVGYGNISVRIPQSNQFYISGTATGGIPELDQIHYPLVERCEPASNSIWCRGLINASSESMSHAVIYQAATEIGAVVHVHNSKIWEKYLNVLPTTDKGIEYGTPEMAYEIGRIMSLPDTLNKNIIIMGGHEEGILSIGKTVEEAALIILRMEDGS
jgi:L-ribulose-5-phosphate 4-epimerase